MQTITIRKHHKWFGLIMSFFIMFFCLSGLLLNHRRLISDCNVSRKLLPARYEFRNWNGGLLRGTHRLASGQIIVYGANGMFLTDSTASTFADFNNGLPDGTDYRQIRGVVTTFWTTDKDGKRAALFAVSPFALYRYGLHGGWNKINMGFADGERLTDITAHNDTLVVLGRSYMYVSLPPYNTYKRIQLEAPSGYDGSVSTFRTVWLLHSGELFGNAGVAVVDTVAIALILICLSGLVFFTTKKVRPSKDRMRLKASILRMSLSWHDRIGRLTVVLTLLICITGWCLRPPVMIPLALTHIPAIPGTSLYNDNAWHDKLRMIRHDSAAGDWMVSTSEGFYSIGNSIASPATPQRIAHTPPVSVMGLNVWQQNEKGRWLCGSFSGMYEWDRQKGLSTDYFTHQPAPVKSGPPFGKTAVSGYSNDFSANTPKNPECTAVIAEYYDGTSAIRQPQWMNDLPMSLWNVALEIHSGRMFIGDIATYVFVFFAGLASAWCIWTGYKIRKKRH